MQKRTDYKFSLVWAVVSLSADTAPLHRNQNHKQNENNEILENRIYDACCFLPRLLQQQ